MESLALPLGADVPFFVRGHNAFVEGIGERITPIDLAPQHYAVVKPPVSIATQTIFASPDLVRNTESVIVESFLAGQREPAGLDLSKGFGRNDLQAPAIANSAEVASGLAILEARFGNGRMTGSGSAVFARVAAAAGPEALVDLPPGWSGRMCQGMRVHPLADWAHE